eukprot:jgi/Astpho2/4670/gw1.00067.35.1_t
MPLSKLLAYHTDLWLSKSPTSKIWGLLAGTMLLSLFGGISLFVVSDDSIYTSLWEAFDGLGLNWRFAEAAASKQSWAACLTRILAVCISIGGSLVTALLLGLTSEAIDNKIGDLKKGRAEVLESEHILVLGWSNKLLRMLVELCNANAQRGGCPIVIMAERDKTEMESEVSKHEFDLQGSRIICRSGDPLLKADLMKVSVSSAATIIVLASEETASQSDARVLRIVLMLMSIHAQLGSIIVEIRDVQNEMLIKLVGMNIVTSMVSQDIIGRLMILCARQPGLSGVWEALFQTEGKPFHIYPYPDLVGLSYGDVFLAFPDAIVAGVTSDHKGLERSYNTSIIRSRRKVFLNPPDDYRLQQDDELVLLTEHRNCQPQPQMSFPRPGEYPELEDMQAKEMVLFLGWPDDLPSLIMVLDPLVMQGSELWLYSDVPIKHRRQMLARGGLDFGHLVNLSCKYAETHLKGSLLDRKQIGSLRLSQFSAIVIFREDGSRPTLLAPRVVGNEQALGDADARSLACLLLLRHIQVLQRKGLPVDAGGCWKGRLFEQVVKESVIVLQIMEQNTRRLLKDYMRAEFLMANELISVILAAVVEQPAISTILRELQSEVGNEIHIHSTARFIREGEVLTMNELMLRARQRLEIVIGYRLSGQRHPTLNPKGRDER